MANPESPICLALTSSKTPRPCGARNCDPERLQGSDPRVHGTNGARTYLPERGPLGGKVPFNFEWIFARQVSPVTNSQSEKKTCSKPDKITLSNPQQQKLSQHQEKPPPPTKTHQLTFPETNSSPQKLVVSNRNLLKSSSLSFRGFFAVKIQEASPKKDVTWRHVGSAEQKSFFFGHSEASTYSWAGSSAWEICGRPATGHKSWIC